MKTCILPAESNLISTLIAPSPEQPFPAEPKYGSPSPIIIIIIVLIMPLWNTTRSQGLPKARGYSQAVGPFMVQDRKSSHAPSSLDLFHYKENKEKMKSVADRLPNSKNNNAKGGAAKAAQLAMDIESPPLVLHGTTAESSGALLSGQLDLTVTEADIELATFEMRLLTIVTTKKPVSKDCPDCQSTTTELKEWRFLSEKARFPRGTHRFPFSYLIPGHVAATSHGIIGSVDYLLSARAVDSHSQTDVVAVERPLDVGRALFPGPDRTSIRIFPPIALTATVILPSVIHPIGEFPVRMHLADVAESDQSYQRRWQIRKLNWRIDETVKMTATACAKHRAKIVAGGGGGRGLVHHQEIRTLAAQEFKHGWKSDFGVAGGTIEMEFPASIRAQARPVCDVETTAAVPAAGGLTVSHLLVLELIIGEELAPVTNLRQSASTGVARVLRMQFRLVLTERQGLGISWDEEQPPVYEDVPASPPSYAQMVDYGGEVLGYELDGGH